MGDAFIQPTSMKPKWQILCFLFLVLTCFASAQKASEQYIELSLPSGNVVIRLFNETPRHRDNFLHLVKSGYLNKLTIDRIVKDFVIQGGDADSSYLDITKLNSFQHWIQPEFNDSLFHKKGVIAMGHDGNSTRSSFSTQFYFVTGKTWNDKQMDSIEQKTFKGQRKIPEWQRSVYKTEGGAPFLDYRYTVFGEVVSGLDVLDQLNQLPVLKDDVPEKRIPVHFKMLKKKEIRKIKE